MAVITASSVTGSGQQPVTVTTLGASDTFVYKQKVNATLVFNNVSGGALTPLIVGVDATTHPCPGIGDIDTSVGHQMTSIGIGAVVTLPLDSISANLKGVITITDGDAIDVHLLEYA